MTDIYNEDDEQDYMLNPPGAGETEKIHETAKEVNRQSEYDAQDEINSE